MNLNLLIPIITKWAFGTIVPKYRESKTVLIISKYLYKPRELKDRRLAKGSCLINDQLNSSILIDIDFQIPYGFAWEGLFTFIIEAPSFEDFKKWSTILMPKSKIVIVFKHNDQDTDKIKRYACEAKFQQTYSNRLDYMYLDNPKFKKYVKNRVPQPLTVQSFDFLSNYVYEIYELTQSSLLQKTTTIEELENKISEKYPLFDLDFQFESPTVCSMVDCDKNQMEN